MKKCLIKVGALLSIVVAFTFLFVGIFSSSNRVYAAWSGKGDGTADNPYQIGTKEELKKFRDIVNGTGGETKNLSVCGKLTADIDLNNEEWTPIGNKVTSHEYNGTFDGNKKTIKGLAINETNDSAGVGLFGRIYGATIKNLTVEGSVSGGTSVGGIVGYAHAYPSDFATITGCISNVTVTGVSRVGGVVGEASQCNVSNCRNIGNITGTGNDNVGGTGGIVGIIDNSTKNITVSNCFNTGKIVSVYQAGGIVGFNYSNPDTHNWVITNCYNTGDIEASVGRAGGITGYNNGKVEKCHNVGKVITPNADAREAKYAGGIIGLFLDNDAYAPINCYYLEGCVQGKTENRAGGRYKQLSDPILFEGNHLSASSFKDSASFKELDFDKTWKMGENYPILIANVEETEQIHYHGKTRYEKWSATDSLPTTAGNYYLANDVILSSTWNVPSGTTNLCLNGHGIIGNGFSGMLICASNISRLVIDDCSNTEHRYSVADSDTYNGAGLATVNDNLTKNYLTFKGGYITGGNLNTNSDYAAITAKNDGVIKINGGTIIGNKNTNGHGAVLYSSNCGVLEINGGSIIHNLCQQAAVYSCVVGTLSINGGVIAYNASVNQSIAGVSTTDSADLSMSGLPLIKNNYGPNNTGVDLRLGKPIYFVSNFTPKGKIGVNVGTTTGEFTQNWNEIMGEKDPYDYFYGQDSDKPYIGLKDGNLALFAEKQVARAGNNTYESLLAAYNACAENGTITLFEDIDLTQENVTINIANSITIDLKGKNLKFAENQIVLSGSANLTIDNSKIKSGGINGIIPETASASVTFKNARTNYTSEEIATSSYLKLADEFVAVNINEDGSADTNGFKTIIRSSNSVAEVNGVLYPSLKQAYEECEEDDTIILLADIDLTGKSIYFQIVKNITIDLNGHIFSTWDQSCDSIYIYKDNYVILKNSVSKSGGYKNGLEFSAKFSGSKNHSFIVLDNGVRTTYDVDLFNEDNEYFIVADGFVARYINSNKSADENGFKSIIGNPYTPLDPNGTPTVNKPDHTPLYVGDEITVSTDANPVVIKWYYVDENGNPTGDSIGEGTTYTIKKPNDLGKKIVAVITQNEDENGNPYEEGKIPTQTTDVFVVYKPIDAEEEVEINTIRTNPINGDEISVTPPFTPSTVKWYYDDNNDGKPDSSTPIGTGNKYKVVCPDTNDENHDDTGHTIIAVISQNVDENGNPITTDIPTTTTKGVKVYTPLDITTKTSINKNNDPLLVGDEISIETEATDVTFEWFYIDEDGNPTGDAIGTEKTYTVKSPNDLGKKIIAVVTQNKKPDGTDYAAGEKPKQYSDPLDVYKPFDTNSENKPEIEIPNDKEKAEDGDDLIINVDATPVNIKWYYDDDHDGLPDSNNPIGEGKNYIVKCPNENDEHHNDKGHTIIGVITQDKKPDGSNYPAEEVPTFITKPITVSGKLPKTAIVEIGRFYLLGDTILFEEDSYVKINPEENVLQKAGKVLVTYKLSVGSTVGSTVRFKDMFYDTNNNYKTLYVFTISTITTAEEVAGLKCVSGDGTSENPYEFMAVKKEDIYSPLDPNGTPTVNKPDHTPLYVGEEITVSTDATPVVIKWYYVDENGNPTGDPIGEGTTYTIKKPNDLGKKIVAVITQNEDENGDPITGDIPTQITDVIEIYKPIDEEEVEIDTTRTNPVNGDEISVTPPFTPSTVKWYYDDDNDGKPDSSTPIGTGNKYKVVCPDPNDENHDDTGHTIIAVISQDKDENGNPYDEDKKPTTTTKGVKVYTPLDATTKTSINTPNHDPLLEGDEISIDTDATYVTFEWFYTDEDGNPIGEAIGTEKTYTIKAPNDLGKKITAVITQNKKSDGTDYDDAAKPKQYSNVVSVYKSLDTDPENRPDVEGIGEKPKAENGDEIVVNVDSNPVEIKWYYDDNNDGLPDDPTKPIGEGTKYQVVCPDEKDPTHDDQGHTIIAVITQPKKPDGTSYPADEIPTISSKPVVVKGVIGGFEPLAPTAEPTVSKPEHEPLFNGDEIEVEITGNPVKVEWFYDDDNDGLPDDPTKPIGEGTKYQVVCPDPNDPTHDDRGHNIIPRFTQDKDENGDPLPENEWVVVYGPTTEVYKPLEEDTVVLTKTPTKPNLETGDEIELEVQATPVSAKWYYDDNEDGIPDDLNNPIGEGMKYAIKDEDKGHVIVAIISQDKDKDGNDYSEEDKPQIRNTLVSTTGFKHVHNFTYEATENMILASCTDLCDIYEGLVLTLVAPTNLSYDGGSKTATLEAGYNKTAFPNVIISYYQGDKKVLSAKEIGVYVAKVTFGDATAEVTFEIVKGTPEVNLPKGLTIANGSKLSTVTLPKGFRWVNPDEVVNSTGEQAFKAIYTPTDTTNYNEVEVEIKLESKWDIKDETTDDVRVDIKNDEGAPFDGKVSVKVEVKTDVNATAEAKEYKEIEKNVVTDGNEITFIYSVKLIRTVVKDGQEVTEEIQPSDIKEGTVIVITMNIPEELRGKEFKVLHIHNEKETSYVDYKVSADGKSITFEVTKLSEFAFVSQKTSHGFCIGYVVLIFVILALLCLPVYVILYFGLCKNLVSKLKLDKLNDKLDLIGLVCMCVAAAIFIFALVALIVHVCAVTIVSFVLAFLVCLAFTCLFLLKKFKKDNKEEKNLNNSKFDEEDDDEEDSLTLEEEYELALKEEALENATVSNLESESDEIAEDEKEDLEVETRKEVFISEVNELMSDEVANSLIIDERKERVSGKKQVINIADLMKNFEDGDTITIEKLKEKGLVPNNVKQVKLLALGSLNKKFNVELQDFSIEAAKMIILTGGTIKRV